MIQQIVDESEPTAGLVADGKIKILVKIARQSAADVVRFGAEFGLTPSSRVRLAIEPLQRKKSKFEGLIGGLK